MRKIIILLVFFVLLIFPVEAAPVLKIYNGTTNKSGTTIINITALDVTDLANFNINVSYDSNVVNVTGETMNPTFSSDISNLGTSNDGFVRIANFNVGGGQTGDVWISKITFEALGSPGDLSSINLTIITFANSSTPPNSISATIENGTFRISSLYDSKDESPPSDPANSGTWGTAPTDIVKVNGTGWAPSQNMTINTTYPDGSNADFRSAQANSSGGFEEFQLRSFGTDGVYKIWVSIDGNNTWVQYDTFTVSAAVPEYPFGAGLILAGSALVYGYMRRHRGG